MSTPSLAYLALDSSNDPDFDPANALTGAPAVAQDILTRLRLWYGEWWENLGLGTPMLQVILGHGASSAAQASMSLVLQAQIQQASYVQKVLDVQVAFVDGRFTYKCTVQTAFGLVNVNDQLGQNAAL